MAEPITFTGQLFDIKTRRDGGGRVQIEFGADAMAAIAELMHLNAVGQTNLGIAIVPVVGGYNQGDNHRDEQVDPETGEVIL